MGLRVPSSQRKESAVQEIGEAGKYFSNVSVRELRAKENGATGTGALWNVALVVNQSRSLLSYHARASGAMDGAPVGMQCGHGGWAQDVGNAVRLGSASWMQVTVIPSLPQRAEHN